MTTTETIGASVRSVNDPDTGALIGYRGFAAIWRGFERLTEHAAPLIRTDLTEAWRDARVLRVHLAAKHAITLKD